jgi:aerobic-type carbon monoxide dehydrogenase small subunit (CoxS/CutS family)
MAKVHVTTTVNGEPMEFLCEPYETMLDALRGQLGLTGSKEGCASGDCGACSITLDDRLVCSCLMLAAEASSCIRCSRSSSSMPRFNAASAPRACWSPPKRS